MDRSPWQPCQPWSWVTLTPLLVTLTSLALPISAQSEPTSQPALETAPLARVDILARHDDNTLGSSDAASQGVIRADQLKSRPTLRPGEVLEFVPGLVVTQHSGDGKANQYFLRGFNLDHGTDFATSVNGLPVNMPTHAHGQGYADLNFLIPELVQRIDYRKGPYLAQNGDFASAGSADIAYRRTLTAPTAMLTLGSRGFRRALAAGSGEVASGVTLLGAFEGMVNDGPWSAPEALQKRNAVLTLSGGTAAQSWSASLMNYAAHWTSTDQVPQRLLDAGTYNGQPFGRFDSLDPSDGGRTSRRSLSASWQQRDDQSLTQVAAYAIDYSLSIYSNFTYALDRPTQGDQFLQQDDRRIYGLNISRTTEHELMDRSIQSEWGLQVRQDQIRVGLFDTVGRHITATTRQDVVRQTLLGLYGQVSMDLTPWLRSVAGLRFDQAAFDVDSQDLSANSGKNSAQRISPKLSLIFGPWQRTEYFVNAGRGLHSNDARGTTTRIDPKTGQSAQPVPGLVSSRGLELGVRSEWVPGWQSSLAVWQLDFDSELVYVGDAGATEPNRPSTRHGVEWNNRWAVTPRLRLDADLAWTQARFADTDPAGDRIPNAVDQVASLALTAPALGPWSASMQWRYIGSGALIEDNSLRSNPSLTTNLRLSRTFGQIAHGHELTLDVFNLFDRRVNDIEYAYVSRLPTESAPVLDRHVHPAEPRSLRLSLKLAF